MGLPYRTWWQQQYLRYIYRTLLLLLFDVVFVYGVVTGAQGFATKEREFLRFTNRSHRSGTEICFWYDRKQRENKMSQEKVLTLNVPPTIYDNQPQ